MKLSGHYYSELQFIFEYFGALMNSLKHLKTAFKDISIISDEYSALLVTDIVYDFVFLIRFVNFSVGDLNTSVVS
jgi:hypothetical protein